MLYYVIMRYVVIIIISYTWERESDFTIWNKKK